MKTHKHAALLEEKLSTAPSDIEEIVKDLEDQMLNEELWKTTDLATMKKTIQSNNAKISGFLSVVDQLS